METATPSKEHAVETVNLIKWMITDGQKYSPELLYVPIPAEVTQIGLDGLDKVTYDGMSLSAGAVTEPQSLPSPDAKSGGCLIATAAFGSEACAASTTASRSKRQRAVGYGIRHGIHGSI
ncbi:hypothetical protein [Candidatus Nitrosotenuis chungbukensis]|uniref:hypothetical protein n=1 Tax=Candidatus Nitrosotenuis chungbukensis TaxID=1353246 RepID=UPI003B9679E3